MAAHDLAQRSRTWSCTAPSSTAQAVFPETTSVMCAVVHSSTGLAQGWELRLDPQSQVESWQTSRRMDLREAVLHSVFHPCSMHSCRLLMHKAPI